MPTSVAPRTRTVAAYDGPTDDPARVVAEGEELDGGDVLPGFTLAVATLFRDLPRE